MTSAGGRRTKAISRVLVVEDDYFIARDLADMLKRIGLEVVGPASRIDAALTLIATAAPDAAMLDVNLQGERVFPLADELAKQGIPFLFVTGYDASDLPAAYRHVPRVEKPYQQNMLSAAISALRG